jgi:hypothetical protein
MGHFSKANWRALKYLVLGKYHINAANNNIGDKGCKYLSRVNIQNIKLLSLRNLRLIKINVPLEVLEFYIFPNLHGED